ncbi:MAG: DUF6624 domain-containing protein [Hellea sp.]
MIFGKGIFAASILCAAGAVQACANAPADEMSGSIDPSVDIAALQQNLEKARHYDYCSWAYEQGGKALTLPNYDAMLDRETSTLSHDERQATTLLDAGTRIAQSSKTQKACVRAFGKGTKTFDKAMKKSLASHWSKAKYKKSDNKAIASVQESLATHWVEDQAARRVYLASRTEDKTGAEHWTRRLSIITTSQADARSTQYMRGLLKEYDWIDKTRFGDRVSMAAWLIVQHADAHVDLQMLALERMESYLENGGVSKGNYAFLWDRVAVNSDRQQRYGTQPTWECTPEGTLTLQPLEDPDNVNARRAAMGLGTVEDGLAGMAKSVCG